MVSVCTEGILRMLQADAGGTSLREVAEKKSFSVPHLNPQDKFAFEDIESCSDQSSTCINIFFPSFYPSV